MSTAEKSHIITDSKGCANLVTQPVAYDPFAFTSNDNKKKLPLMVRMSKEKAKAKDIPLASNAKAVKEGKIAGAQSSRRNVMLSNKKKAVTLDKAAFSADGINKDKLVRTELWS